MNKTPLAALALAGVFAIGATTNASAAWRGHHGHWGGPGVGIAAGVAAGALIGSAVAARPYGGYYGEPSYGYYGEPSYGYYEAPAGSYYQPYSYNNWYGDNCDTHPGGGRTRDCSAGATSR